MYLGLGVNIRLDPGEAGWGPMNLALGVKGRGFYRVAVPAFDITLPRYIHFDNVQNIGNIRPIELLHGPGYSLDLYASLDLHDPFVNARLSVQLLNVSNRTFYQDGITTRAAGAITICRCQRRWKR